MGRNVNNIGDIRGGYRITGIAGRKDLPDGKRKIFEVVCISCGKKQEKDSKQLYASASEGRAVCECGYSPKGFSNGKPKERTIMTFPVDGGELGLGFICGRI